MPKQNKARVVPSHLLYFLRFWASDNASRAAAQNGVELKVRHCACSSGKLRPARQWAQTRPFGVVRSLVVSLLQLQTLAGRSSA